jgi:integrase
MLLSLESKRVAEINPKMWRERIDAAAARGLSRRTCKNFKRVITAFIDFCGKSRWSVDVPEHRDITVPMSAPVGERRIVQPAALDKLFTIDHITKYKRQQTSFFIHAWRFLVLTGLPRGELCGLRNDEISGSIMHVRRSINAQNEETVEKNDNARRCVHLSQNALAVLADQRAMLLARAIKSPWVFPDEDGNRFNSNHL